MFRAIYQVDAFTDQPYGGNPAGVVSVAEGLTANQMQQIAREMNVSETAFLLPGGSDCDFEVRFFTPTEEVDLCGHATIAAFYLLRELGIVPEKQTKLVQKTRAGRLEIVYQTDGSVLMLQAAPTRIKDVADPARLAAIMGLDPLHVGISGKLGAPEIWSTGLADIMLPVGSLEALKTLAPDMDQLAEYSKVQGVIGVHAFAFDEEGQLWCRNFAPACGIPEEAATGTSNGALGACLHHHGGAPWNDLQFTAHQGDWMGRPSRIAVRVTGGSTPSVWVGGRAVTTLKGEILEPGI